jgi:tetratricopeptide (TPR) repeat protein
MIASRKRFKITRALILVAAFLFVLESSSGQDSSVIIDPWNKTDTTGYGAEIKRLIKKANGLSDQELESAQLVLDSAFELIKVAPDLKKYAIWLGNRGLILENNGRPGEASYWLRLSLGMASKYGWTIMRRQLTNVVGCNYISLGKYDSALHYELRFVNLASAAKDSAHLFIGYVNLGVIYFKLTDPRNTLVFCNRAKNIQKGQGIDQLYLNMGFSYYYLNQYDSALRYYQLAHDECQYKCSNSHMIQYHYGIGQVFRNMEKFDSARYHFNESKRIAKIKEDEKYLAENALMLGEIDIEIGNYLSAKKELEYAESLSRKNSLSATEQRAYLNFIDLFEKTGNLEKKALYQSRYIKKTRIVYNEELLNKIALMEAENNELANVKKIEAQKSLLMLQNDITDSRNKVLVLVGMVGGLLLIVFVLLIIATNKKIRINVMLEHLVEIQTKDLEVSYSDAFSSNESFDHRTKSLASNLKSHFATLKGFCSLGISELNNSEKEVLSHVFSRISEIENLGIKMSD